MSSRAAIASRAPLGVAAVAAFHSLLVPSIALSAETGTINTAPKKPDVETVTVTAKRLNLMDTATTASEGVVSDAELQLTPAYRPGQLLETVPGLIVTLHSGEGKANQFLMRGYNLDHGTDLETYVDGMPINQPTHAHGQGYTDLNFLIPELAEGVRYTKGPYYADIGDFGSVGSVHMSIRDSIADEATVSVGTYGFERLFAAGAQSLGDGEVMEAGEIQHYDGPFTNPDDARKVNAVLRYSEGDDTSGYSVTGMIYHQLWTNTTDVPLRAIAQGDIGRFGTLDPSDGGNAVRGSFSSQYHAALGGGQFNASAFFIFNELHLFNDFTHYLADPVHGDQEDQFENRSVFGGTANYTISVPVWGLDNQIRLGALTRYDLLHVGRLPSEGEHPLTPTESAGDPASYSNDDHVRLFAGAIFAEATTHWTSALRSVVGIREDFQDGTDHDLLAALHETDLYTNGGTKSQSLPQPKASIIYQPSEAVELYASGGEGFHSADLRGVNQDKSINLGLPNTPLLAKQYGEEIGARTALEKYLTFTVAFYNLWQQSETIIDPDVGQDTAGPPSERYGYEVNVTYQIREWLEFYGSYSGNHTRFTQDFDDGTGHYGKFITDAPRATGSFALYLEDLGPWSGGLVYRYMSGYPLSSGPCVSAYAQKYFGQNCGVAPTAVEQVNGKGFGQLNLDGHYTTPSGWVMSLGIYNLLNTRASAAEFWYVDRLKNEVGSFPDGRADIHEHPLEPLMFRLSISKQFD